MRIEFSGKTNKDYIMVNTAVFHLRDGGTVTLDRDETDYCIENGTLSMVWNGIYLWEINGVFVFGTPMYPAEDLSKLLEGSWVELELEDDADEDYRITDVKWVICGENGLAYGYDKK